MRCSKCGRDMPSDARFCPWCGTVRQAHRRRARPLALLVCLAVGAVLVAVLSKLCPEFTEGRVSVEVPGAQTPLTLEVGGNGRARLTVPDASGESQEAWVLAGEFKRVVPFSDVYHLVPEAVSFSDGSSCDIADYLYDHHLTNTREGLVVTIRIPAGAAEGRVDGTWSVGLEDVAGVMEELSGHPAPFLSASLDLGTFAGDADTRGSASVVLPASGDRVSGDPVNPEVRATCHATGARSSSTPHDNEAFCEFDRVWIEYSDGTVVEQDATDAQVRLTLDELA